MRQQFNQEGISQMSYGTNYRRDGLYALTLNNLACYYKKASKPNVALRFME